jgi:DNA-binding XRE family transcriptional regulator
MIGQRFGRLVVVVEADKGGGHRRWLCRCDCGQHRVVWQMSLNRGSTKSCGCLKSEVVRSRWQEYREPAFWGRVAKGSGCWEWSGSLDSGGYGVLGYEGQHWKAHRLAWRLTFGEIPKGIKVCHHCDNPKCCRPDHLFLGTQLHNVKDCVRKGRRFNFSGENNGRAKLTFEDAEKIRQLYAERLLSQEAIGRAFGVSQHAISMIVRNKRYVKKE